MTDAPLLDAIANPFIESAKRDSFNGVRASLLLRLQPNPEKLRASLSAFIRDGQVTAVFSRLSVNMRIKRFPDPPVEEQLKLLIDEPLETFCMYPTASVVEPRVDLSVWQHRPFSKALLLAEAQLSFRAFDMGALERYVADPRYDVHFEDYEGRMSVTNEFFGDAQHPERDKVSLSVRRSRLCRRHLEMRRPAGADPALRSRQRHADRYKGQLKLKDWAFAIARRSTMRKARVALARRLAIIMHAMLRDGTAFVPV